MIFDLGERTQLELTGKDRAKFLHGFCTNDIKGLTPGRGCEAFVCNIQGKVLGHIFVFCTETSLWIDSVPGQEDALFNHLDRYLINEDVQIHRRTAERGDIYVQRPSTPELWKSADWSAAANLGDQPVLSHATVVAGEAPLQVRRVDWLGEPGWLISGPRAALSPSPLVGEGGRRPDEGELTAPQSQRGDDRIPAAVNSPSPPAPLPPGERGGIRTPADSANWNALRIEAGFPLYGVDITSENLAQEVNRTARCVSFNKGCYLGQEPIARIDALGHVNRELHRLEIEDDAVPAAGTPLFDAPAGTQVGVITSAAISAQTPGKIVGLGYLRTKFCSPGTQVVIPPPSADVSPRVATVR